MPDWQAIQTVASVGLFLIGIGSLGILVIIHLLRANGVGKIYILIAAAFISIAGVIAAIIYPDDIGKVVGGILYGGAFVSGMVLMLVVDLIRHQRRSAQEAPQPIQAARPQQQQPAPKPAQPEPKIDIKTRAVETPADILRRHAQIPNQNLPAAIFELLEAGMEFSQDDIAWAQYKNDRNELNLNNGEPDAKARSFANRVRRYYLANKARLDKEFAEMMRDELEPDEDDFDVEIYDDLVMFKKDREIPAIVEKLKAEGVDVGELAQDDKTLNRWIGEHLASEPAKKKFRAVIHYYAKHNVKAAKPQQVVQPDQNQLGARYADARPKDAVKIAATKRWYQKPACLLFVVFSVMLGCSICSIGIALTLTAVGSPDVQAQFFSAPGAQNVPGNIPREDEHNYLVFTSVTEGSCLIEANTPSRAYSKPATQGFDVFVRGAVSTGTRLEVSAISNTGTGEFYFAKSGDGRAGFVPETAFSRIEPWSHLCPR